MAHYKSSSLRDLLKTAEIAIGSIGLGYDITLDLQLKYCKREFADSCLINIENDQGRDVVLPGGITIPNVPSSIKCDKGERTHFRSDVLSFQQMCEQFNQEVSISGKIPSGLFNTMFEFSGCWQKDAASTKALAFDGWFITLYSIALAKPHILLHDYVKRAVPSSWDPAALASFIEKYGTHIVVGIKMGGKDVVYVKQPHSSPLQPADILRRLKEIADKKFSDASTHCGLNAAAAYEIDRTDIREHRLRFGDSSPSMSYTNKEDLIKIYKRRGGNKALPHEEWLETIQFEPGVISMSFVPITSLLSGVPGSGFLSHAINLYLRYKPKIEDLHQFLEFQLPRQWAPVFSELPLGPQRKQRNNTHMQFSFMGPKLYINTFPVDVGMRPVTGLRLYLEGKRSNRLAIHLQHLSSLPKSFQLRPDPFGNFERVSYDRRFYESVQWKSCSQVCTAPVEADSDFSIVTGAQLEVSGYGLKKVLFLRLHFYTVVGATQVKQPMWEGSPGLAQKSGFMSMLMSGQFTAVQKPPPRPADVNINSAVYPGGPPSPARAPKLHKFVDTTEMTRGPQDQPGYWVVSGAKLCVDKGKISIQVKYSLLAVSPPDEEMIMDDLPDAYA